VSQYSKSLFDAIHQEEVAMSKFQILLALSGSKSAECAAELSWDFARKDGITILAQHVVNTKDAVRLFNCSEPGLVGSGLYAQAYDSLRTSLYSIAEKLSEKYEALANSKTKTNHQIVIDEGDPLFEILKRAETSDLVVAGKPSSHVCLDGGEDSKTLVEHLVEQSPVPVALLNRTSDDCSILKILVSTDQQDVSYIRECIKFADRIGKQFELVLIYTPSSDPDICMSIGNRLKRELPEIGDVRFKLRVLEDPVIPDAVALWKHCRCNLSIDVAPSALMVVPTRIVDGKRMTIFGIKAGDFVHRTMTSSALFWPEEFRIERGQEESRVLETARSGRD